MLARREHSRHELKGKLLTEDVRESDLDDLLDELEKQGWMSEARVVEQTLHTRGRRFGSARVLHELHEKGVSREALERARSALRETELQRARDIWRQRFGIVPVTQEERAKQARFLQSRGFALEVITKIWRQGLSD
jgi:regulatory protein